MISTSLSLSLSHIYMKPITSYISGSKKLSMEESFVSDGTNPPSYGERITVLSMDGGGIRGILPGTILSFLESKLQVSAPPPLSV